VVAENLMRLPLQTYLHNSGTFVSSLLHHVHVTGIPYGTPIYYKCASLHQGQDMQAAAHALSYS
jgi:hypothetical protein